MQQARPQWYAPLGLVCLKVGVPSRVEEFPWLILREVV